MVFDAHLDLALNAVAFRRDLTLPLAQLRARQTPEGVAQVGTPTVTFDEMHRGGVGVVVSTLLARSKPWAGSSPVTQVIPDYPSSDMAHAVAMGQLAWYRLMEARGQLRIVTTAAQLQPPAQTRLPLGVVLTMEGADPVTHPDELDQWHALGVRTLMLAHVGLSHYAHGTPASVDDGSDPRDGDGPLTELGRALLERMAALRMPLDLTHLSDTSLREALDRFAGRVYSSHAGCRAVCDHRRNHDDAVIRRIAQRGGVVGVPMYNAFLEPGYQRGRGDDGPPVALARVVDHIDHVCQLAGSAAHAGIGSDLDGGFGREHVPREIDSIGDLPRLGDALRERGFKPADVQAILGGNWLRFFAEVLP